MEWSLLKISVTVETRRKGTFVFDFTSEELANAWGIISIKELLDKVNEKLKEYE